MHFLDIEFQLLTAESNIYFLFLNHFFRICFSISRKKELLLISRFFFYFRLFEKVVKYFDAFLNLIPLSFVLGFYVSYVASRWWQQFLAIPWPDKYVLHSLLDNAPNWVPSWVRYPKEKINREIKQNQFHEFFSFNIFHFSLGK